MICTRGSLLLLLRLMLSAATFILVGCGGGAGQRARGPTGGVVPISAGAGEEADRGADGIADKKKDVALAEPRADSPAPPSNAMAAPSPAPAKPGGPAPPPPPPPPQGEKKSEPAQEQPHDASMLIYTARV